jgi:hypothetical protein
VTTPPKYVGSRRGIGSAVLVAVVGLLVANAVVVAHQDAEAAADSTLPLDGGNIYVTQDGPPTRRPSC